MARNVPQIVEDRIRRRERRGRHIRIDKSKAISFPRSSRNEDIRDPISLVWNLRYMLAELYGQVGTAVGDISFAVIKNRLTVTFANNTGNGVFSGSGLTWTDGGKAWTVNQWAGYYLKVGTIYYKILSNTATALTLDLSKGEWIGDGSYTLVPFIPNMHKDGFLNPDTSANRRYKIKSNSETIIHVRSKQIVQGTVTTGDAGAPYDTFRDSDFDSYQDDALNDLSVFWLTGNNGGESDTIDDFTGATGEIVVATGFTNAIVASDTFLIIDDMLYAGLSSEWRTEKYYPLSNSDFTSADQEDVHLIQLPTSNGAIVDSRMQAGYAAMYSVEVLSKTQRNISVPIELFEESLRIELTDLGTGTTQVVYNSGFRPSLIQSAEFTLRSNTWHRMDVYLYVADGQIDTPSGEITDFRFDPLSAFITTWRDVVATVPTNIVITGANTSNVDDPDTMLADAIKISWTNSIFHGQGGKTELWGSDTEGGSYTFVDRAESQQINITELYPPDTTKWFKLRHVSSSGSTGPYTTARKGVVSNTGLGNTQVDLIWVDNGGSQVFPNENGWFNDSVLKGKVTVTTDLTIDTIWLWEQNQPAAEDLGSSSPATMASGIIGEAAVTAVWVMVYFTNGQATEWIGFHFKYDKTVPGDPTIDSINLDNFNIEVILNSGYSYPSDFLYFEYHYDADNSAPASDKDIMFTTRDLTIIIPGHPAIKFGGTVYFWIRSRDEAGNAGSWISASISGDGGEVHGRFVVKDLFEMTL